MRVRRKKYAIDSNLLYYASQHTDEIVTLAILKSFDGLIMRYAYMFSRKFPEIALDDYKQCALVKTLVCIKKYAPKNGAFSFPNYLKTALYFGLRRYSVKNISTISYNEKTIEKKLKRVDHVEIN